MLCGNTKFHEPHAGILLKPPHALGHTVPAATTAQWGTSVLHPLKGFAKHWGPTARERAALVGRQIAFRARNVGKRK